MNYSPTQNLKFDPTQLIIDALDREIMKDDPTITKEQLEAERKLMQYYDRLIIAGYTEEQIDAEWQDKTPQEILAGTTQQLTDVRKN